MNQNISVCIIGAGASGLSCLYSFLEAEKENKTIQLICYEKQSDFGGLWNFTNKTGVDEFGEPVHNSMYRHLWSNGAKEALEYPYYTYKEHFKKNICSYPPREYLLDYIKGRILNANNSDTILNAIKLNHVVKSVIFKNSKFEVTVRNMKKNEEEINIFDYLICATGHFSFPNIPHFKGIESFPGRVLHSHDFRNPEEFQNMRVLLIGSSYSAEDIALLTYKYDAKEITISWRTSPIPFKFPEKIKQVPLLKKIEKKTCFFKDGSSGDFDAIILCTGYNHHFPFMENQLKLVTHNRWYCDMLYDGVVFMNNTKLFYIGMQRNFYSFNMYDAQAWYIRDIILGRILIPNKDKMLEEYEEWKQKEANLLGKDDGIHLQADYIKRLISFTDYPDLDFKGSFEIYTEWKSKKESDITSYRDNSHQSLYSGEKANSLKKKWIEIFDENNVENN